MLVARRFPRKQASSLSRSFVSRSLSANRTICAWTGELRLCPVARKRTA